MGVDVQLANMWDGGGEPVAQAAERGVPCHVLNFGERRFRRGSVRRLRGFLREHKFDLVMAYGLRTTLLLRVAAAYRGRPVLVTGLRGMDHWRRLRHVWADRLTDRWMDYYVGVSRAVCRAHLERERVAPEKMLYIPNGIDADAFRTDAEPWPPRAALGLPVTGRLCVSVAHLRAVKGYPWQAEVIARAAAEGLGEDVSFVWVGAGPDERMLRQLVAGKGLGGRVHFHGAARDVRPILAHADAFFMSSREEGMPRALMEAMAMGVASLATRVGGIPEVLRDGVDGLLTPYGDTAAAAASLRRMLDSAELRRTLAAAGRQRITTEFSFDAVTRKYADLYRRLVARDASVSADYGVGGGGAAAGA
jgi:glycosyltransferase involved in cell wall biosynthesis